MQFVEHKFPRSWTERGWRTFGSGYGLRRGCSRWRDGPSMIALQRTNCRPQVSICMRHPDAGSGVIVPSPESLLGECLANLRVPGESTRRRTARGKCEGRFPEIGRRSETADWLAESAGGYDEPLLVTAPPVKCIPPSRKAVCVWSRYVCLLGSCSVYFLG